MSKHRRTDRQERQRYSVVSKERLAALEHNSANARSFSDVIRQGFRWGFVAGLVAGGVASNVVWLVVRYW